MGKLIKILYVCVLVGLYFLLFNLSTLIDFSEISSTLSNNPSGATQIAAFGDSVAVSTLRPGFLWDIKTFYYQDYTDSKIYFFGFVPLPKIIHGYNFILVHYFFGIMFFIIFSKIALTDERGYYG